MPSSQIYHLRRKISKLVNNYTYLHIHITVHICMAVLKSFFKSINKQSQYLFENNNFYFEIYVYI